MSDDQLRRWAPLWGSREVADAEAMEQLGRDIAAVLDAGDVVILSGELGAGKTTLTRGIGQGLGLRDIVTSPTFVVARTHQRADGSGPHLIHVDAYRLSGPAEFDDLDIDAERNIVVVEWGDGMAEELADTWLAVRIHRPIGGDDFDTDSPRRVEISVGGTDV